MEKRRRKCVVCGKPDAQACGQCFGAAYCSRAHQLQHWKAGHKRECWPLKKENHQHLVLTRAVAAGQVVLEERPLAIWPAPRAETEGEEEEEEEGPDGGAGVWTTCMLCLRRIESGGFGTSEWCVLRRLVEYHAALVL